METLPFGVWGIIFGFIPAHRYAARCVCRAWRAFLGEEPAAITTRTLLEILEAGGDPTWLKEAVGGWEKRRTDRLLSHAVTAGNLKGMELAKAWGTSGHDQANRALYRAARRGQLKAMDLLVNGEGWGATDVNWALSNAAFEGQLEAMDALRKWGASDFNDALAFAAHNSHLKAMELLKTWSAAASRSD